MSAGKGAGHGNKHGGSWKHAGNRKKHNPRGKKQSGIAGMQMFPGGPHGVQHHPHHRTFRLPRPNPRGAPLVIGDVHCCTAEALASSLRMAGWPVGDEDVLALYFLTTDDPEAGATIPAMLEAASRFSLAGVHPISWEPIADEAFQPGDIQGWQLLDGDRHTVTMTRTGVFSWSEHWLPGDLPAVAEETWNVRWPR